MDYLDLGSSDSEGEDHMRVPGDGEALDSDEEERRDNSRILQMLALRTKVTPTTSKSRSAQKMSDFEAEMEAELDRRAMVVEAEGGVEHQRSLSRSSSSSSLHSAPGSSKGKAGPSKKVKFADEQGKPSTSAPEEAAAVAGQPSSSEQYDDAYFDSEESEGETEEEQRKRKERRKVRSNDDLFYDPLSDQADQAWMDKQRRKYCRNLKPPPGSSTRPAPSTSTGQEQETKAIEGTEQSERPLLPKTDAVLNCPACFTLLCMDCQRHELYAGQYRAMFVVNCKIDSTQTLTVPLKQQKGKGKRKKEAEPPKDSDKFLPVRCKVCNSQVAVYDNEEIYHFFNCLASNP